MPTPVAALALTLALAMAAAVALGTLARTPAQACAAPGAASQTPPAVETVAVLLTPFLTWDDITSGRAAELRAMANEGAIGDMNSITADWGWPTAAGGALTLSSSRWTAGPVNASATASDLADIRAANAGSLDTPDIGALSAELHAAGLKTAAVGNADEDTSSPFGVQRPAELVALDRAGAIDIRLTGPALLAADPAAPFGVRADTAALGRAIRDALAQHPALLVVDPGDLERAHDATLPAEQIAARHASAVGATSEIAADLRRALAGTRSLLVIVTPATDKPYYQSPYFGPVILVGDGFAGELLSGSTHRPGLVANTDVAPTVVSALALEPTSTMLGQAMGSSGAGTTSLGAEARAHQVDERIAQFVRLGDSVGAVDFVRDLFFIKWFAWIGFWLALAVALIALVPMLGFGRPLARAAILLVLAVPPAAWLLLSVNRYPASPWAVALTMAATTAAVFALAVALTLTLPSQHEVALLSLATLTSLLICVDQWSGHPFETGLFSYSIRAGWRYYGMGNEGAALLVGASIVAVGLACDLAAGTRWGAATRIGLAPVVGLITLFTAAAPFAGANAGAAVWGVVAFGVAWARINGVRFTWRTLGAIAIAVVALLAALVAIDVLSGPAETHLGRFFGEFATGDFSAVRELVVRKALNNYDYLPQSPYTWLAFAMTAALAATRWLGDRPLARILAARDGAAGAVLGVVIGGIAALVTEDSGIVMPALMLFSGTLPILYLVLKTNQPRR